MKKTIRDYDLKDKKVLIRCDFNVPIKDGIIIDDNRIKESIQTIKYAIDNGAKVILLSHLGKIKNEEDKKTKSLNIVSERLGKLLNRKVIFCPQNEGKEVENVINNMKSKDVVLLENTRFQDYPNKRESKNDDSLGKYWASLGDIFINDAFGTSHRSHASNVGIATNLKGNSGIGFLVEKEIDNLAVLNNPDRPYYVILGGAKINDKIEIVKYLVNKADKILIGGGMAFTFLKAKGYEIGNSILDEESIEFCKEMLKKHEDKIILPTDVKVTKTFIDSNINEIVNVKNIKNDDIGLDIGPLTIENFKASLSDAKTVFWNGTLGYSEFKNYEDGTKEILKYLTSNDIKVILGGGDTVAASKTLGYKDSVAFASTGGGAALEFVSGKNLPGIDVIDNK